MKKWQLGQVQHADGVHHQKLVTGEVQHGKPEVTDIIEPSGTVLGR